MMSFAFDVRNHAQRCDKKFTWLNDHIFHLQTARWPKGKFILSAPLTKLISTLRRSNFYHLLPIHKTKTTGVFFLLRDTLIFTQKSHTPTPVFLPSDGPVIAACAGVGCLATHTPEPRPSSVEAILYKREGFTFSTSRRKCLACLFYIMAYHKTNTKAVRVACVTSRSFDFAWEKFSRELSALSEAGPEKFAKILRRKRKVGGSWRKFSFSRRASRRKVSTSLGWKIRRHNKHIEGFLVAERVLREKAAVRDVHASCCFPPELFAFHATVVKFLRC